MRKELTELVKQQAKMKKMVLDAFKDEPKTVPEVAEALNSATHEAMYWVMALRKYGFIEETEEITDDGYYKYQLVEGKS